MKSVLIFIGGLFAFQISHAQNWQQFGNGNPGAVEKLYLDSATNDLYAIGTFWKNITDTAFGVAYLDSGVWKSIGSYNFKGGNILNSLIVYDDTLYVGGPFNKFAGAPSDYLLKWNGTNWDSLIYSPNGQVNCMGYFQGSHYVCGMFGSFGPIQAQNIIEHQIQNWSGLPSVFLMASILSLKEFNNKLIIAGNFGIIGSSNGNVIGWNGVSFSPVDQGITYGGNPPEFIHEMESYNGRLYIAGYGSLIANGVNGNNIISWDGITDWNNVGGGSNGYITDLQEYNGYLYACGTFSIIGNIPVSNIARWDGTTWCSLGSVFDGPVWNMSVYNNELIVAGDFSHIDGLPISHVAKWVGGTFIANCSSYGITEPSASQPFFEINPNPANTFIKIDYHVIEPVFTLRISNLYQETVYLEKLYSKTGTFTLDLQNLAKGFYTVTLLGKFNYGTKSFIH